MFRRFCLLCFNYVFFKEFSRLIAICYSYFSLFRTIQEDITLNFYISDEDIYTQGLKILEFSIIGVNGIRRVLLMQYFLKMLVKMC